jgi:hypothetical protein
MLFLRLNEAEQTFSIAQSPIPSRSIGKHEITFGWVVGSVVPAKKHFRNIKYMFCVLTD